MIIDFRFLGQNGGGMSSGDVQTLIEGYHYVNSGEVETQITEKGYLTSADTQIYLTSADTQNFLTSADTQDFITTADTQNFLTSADTQNFLTSADTQDFITTADTQNFVGVADFEEANEVISTALNDLNTRVASAVTSTNITNILKITQSDYNTLVSAGTISNTTAYYIVPDPVVGE